MAADPLVPLPPADHTRPAPTPGPDTCSFADFDRTLDALSTADPTGSLPTIAGRYQLLEVIGQGGMGRVYAARDTLLDREVAVKTLLCPPESVALHRRRFLAEARISARLAHPGVPPVHDLGELPDGRPFIAMKLIRGRTLADLLDARPGSGHDLPRFVAVFEHLCQAAGFAHSRGVIHRDLKPANVMVGAFGEVQVMDWGLAKVLDDPGGEVREPHPDRDAAADTRYGAILGTVAYMAPEQARGEPAGPHSDVFALGGILCAILTGRPPFAGEDTRSLIKRAAAGDVSDALARLGECGADPELVGIAIRSLAPDATRRPADAGEVAALVAAYRAGVEDRLRRAEAERVAAEARSVELRKRRRVQFALVAAVGLLLLGAGAFGWWQDRQDGRRKGEQAEREFRAEQARSGVKAAVAQAATLRNLYRFQEAAAALDLAAELVDGGGAADLAPEVARAKADLEFARELDAIRMRKSVWQPGPRGTGGFDRASAPPAYRAAFAARGLDVAAGDVRLVADRVRESVVRAQVVAALDDWALDEPDAALRARVLETARAADPGSWTDLFRDPAVRSNAAALWWVARRADPALPPATTAALADLMSGKGLDAARLLTAARARRPDDFTLALALGQHLLARDPAAALGHYRAALALRPNDGTVLLNLGSILHGQPDRAEALVICRRAVEAIPHEPKAHNNLGVELFNQQDWRGAGDAFRQALELDPDYARAHFNLGNVHFALRDWGAAAQEYRHALRLDPAYPDGSKYLGDALAAAGDWSGAADAFRAATRLNPADAQAHSLLGTALAEGGRLPEAVAAFRDAARLDPKNPTPHYQLGVALVMSGRFDAAAAAYREAVRLNPAYMAAHTNLGYVLLRTGDVDGAIAALREAIRLEPRGARAHYTLGAALAEKRDWDGSVAALAEAARLDPANATYRRALEDHRRRAERDARVAPPPRAVSR